jgi:hypothetical protein
MQPIHKSEILEKLSEGWKVRCKIWADGEYVDKKDPIEELIAYFSYDQWEGEPPGPVCDGKELSIIRAFEELRRGAAFIRRPSWSPKSNVRFPDEPTLLTDEDILAADWEVYSEYGN